MLTLIFGVGVCCSLSAIIESNTDDDQFIKECIKSLPYYQIKIPVSGTIDIWGHGSFKHDFMGKLIDKWISDFKRYHPNVEFKNHLYGTASAIGALYTGAGNLAILGEEISPAAEEAFIREKGYQPKKFEIATGSIDINYFDYAHMIFVNKSNPLKQISITQLEGLFGTEHKRSSINIRNWNQLGFTESKEIKLYSWRVDEDFGLFFRERVLLGSHRWNPLITEYTHLIRKDGTQYDQGQRIIDKLATDPYGIGISNIRYATPDVRVLAISKDINEQAYYPTKINLIKQLYPLVRIIPAYIDQPPNKSVEPQLAEFLKFILSRNGQQIMLETSGYLPIDPKISIKQIKELY
jgi:phosphate transport system substrate-binding protein